LFVGPLIHPYAIYLQFYPEINIQLQGITIGPQLCDGLKTRLGARFGCQGIGGGYKAGILDNMLELGTADASIEAALDVFKKVNAKCPTAKLLFMGYSQGAALMHKTIERLPAGIKAQTIGGTLFGDTKNKQSGASIEGYPKDQLATYCVEDDGVCWGGLRVTAGHMAYLTNGDVQKAIAFLAGRAESSSPAAVPAAAAPVAQTPGPLSLNPGPAPPVPA
jgi:cutinase